MTDKLIILHDLKAYLKNRFDDSVKDIVLFGSQATGKSNKNSDYDILIVLDKKYGPRDENKIYDLCYDINLKYDIVIDAHLISLSELNTLKGKQPIYATALKTGIYA
jgi:predicted nucleotidyltransferase